MVGYSKESVGFETPLILEFYFGDIDLSNFHIGAGYTYTYVYSFYSNLDDVILCPQFELGFQVPYDASYFSIKLLYAFNPKHQNILKDAVSIGGYEYSFGFSSSILF